ncbi:winged helix-turn-helix domain-containing protein [Natrinema pallidum]|uniref:Winged helix-turn-helix transcriptional regulator n=1 Tax=Natrinema pallidum TaxID=69527 RepID=A0A4P9TBH7_9EURY|nr:winged helix-turn-helix domain-containing protein [Natrinema pallidum]QCW01981.1 winged helix-turn-helix transcriptional regulator [Natrinema pallidum]
MEKALWYLIAGTRGGENRARIIRALEVKPRNANQLAEELEVDYNTVRHHLELLEREFDAAIAAAVETEMEHERRGEVVR